MAYAETWYYSKQSSALLNKKSGSLLEAMIDVVGTLEVSSSDIFGRKEVP